MNEISATRQNGSIRPAGLNLPDDLVPFYDDGPDWPTTDEREQAERAYRDAFLQSAREAANWTSIDKDAIERA